MIENLKIYFLTLLAVIIASSCSSDSSQDSPEVPVGSTTLYLSLNINLEDNGDELSSRANPTGGEDGDGREDALARENAIHRIDMVFFNAMVDNDVEIEDPINDSRASQIEIKRVYTIQSLANLSQFHSASGNSDIREGFYLIKIDNYHIEEGDRVFVYVNSPSDLGITEGAKIETLRDICPRGKTWRGTRVNDATDFTMATARTTKMESNGLINGKINFKIGDRKISGTKDDPYYVSATVERTAARIDLWFPNSVKTDVGSLIYNVKDVGGNFTGDKVKITHIRPINLMSRSSYWFKHVTKSFEDHTISYCASESPDPSGVPHNYVVEPTTSLKSSTSENTQVNLVDWFGDSLLESVPAGDSPTDNTADVAYFTNDYSISELFNRGEIQSTDDQGEISASGSMTSLILSYANENTIFGSDFSNADKYLTGLIFRAIYIHANGPEEIKYYQLKIFHANDNGQDIPMRYGIVRNNIYRIAIAFEGESSGEAKFQIFCRKWNLREHHEIVM